MSSSCCIISVLGPDTSWSNLGGLPILGEKLLRFCSEIRECGSTLYVGLTGIVRTLIQKSTGIVQRILSISFFPLQDE